MNTFAKKLLVLASAIVPVACAQQAETTQCKSSIDNSIYENLPFSMPQVIQPSFPDYTVNIKDFGAQADGKTLNTQAINNAIKAVHEKGGGKVVIPEGLWLTGPIELLSNVNLYTEKNALVLFTDDFQAYPIIKTSFEGLETRRCQSPISARNAENIAITGHGVFDGSGDSWRPVKKGKMTSSQWKTLVASGGVVALASPRPAQHCKKQERPARRRDLQELTQLVPAPPVVRTYHDQQRQGIQPLVFTKRRCARFGIVQQTRFGIVQQRIDYQQRVRCRR